MRMLSLIYALFQHILANPFKYKLPDSKVHGANVGPIWGRQDPGGPHVGPMNFAMWAVLGNKEWIWRKDFITVTPHEHHSFSDH